MKLALTGNEWVQVVLALANVAANRSYNTLGYLLSQFGCSVLCDDSMNRIASCGEKGVELGLQGNTSWQVIVDALSELPIKQVGSLYAKVTQAMSGARAGEAT